ncbi:MAG: hypothetical protein AB1782_19650 [Cyanobacteriota bacterium]
MVSIFLKWFKSLFILCLLVMTANNFTYAYDNLSKEEKTIFYSSNILGECSFLISDVLSNSQIMGVANLDAKLEYVKKQLTLEPPLVEDLKVSKKTLQTLKKFIEEVNESYNEKTFKLKKLEQANKTFGDYSVELREDINKLYGPKYTWLFDTGFLVSFTKASMISDYKNKLVLLEYKFLLDYVPYNMPTSVISSLSSIATVKDEELTQNQVEILKEASDNMISYFTSPETYSPPATLRDLVGKWEGRLAPPNGDYHKANISITPDMSAILNVEGMFKDMPVNDLTVTQSLVSFNIKPFADEQLIIRFSGRIVDDVLSGEAIDVSGKKGLWQFLKTPQVDLSELVNAEIKTEPTALDKLSGVWKGKILEQDGAISNLTLRFNIVDDSVMFVENPNHKKTLKLNSVAANDKAVRFSISPDNGDINITFMGEIKGRILEGNAIGTDGNKAYWKIIKVEDKLTKPQLKSDAGFFFLDHLCDPIVDNSFIEGFTLVSKNIIVPPPKINEGKYKGHLIFEDGSRAGLVLVLSNKQSKMYLFSKEDNSKISLDIDLMNITDREITIDTTIDGNKDTLVKFKGKVFGGYIYGDAVNIAGENLKWELMAVDKADTFLSNVNSSNVKRIKGLWNGMVTFSNLFEVPVKLVISDDETKMYFDDAKILLISDIILDGTSVSFVAKNEADPMQTITFNGNLEEQSITGKITTVNGLGLDVVLSMSEKYQEDPLKGIWAGRIMLDNASADIVFDFVEDKKKVYIDDSRAESGRVELLISNLVKDSKGIKFTANTSKSPSKIEFVGTFDRELLKGSAKNQIQGSNKLNWETSKSNLSKYDPESIEIVLHSEPENAGYKKTFSFLDEMDNLNDSKIDNETNDKVTEKEDKTTSTIDKKPDETEIKENKTDEILSQKVINADEIDKTKQDKKDKDVDIDESSSEKEITKKNDKESKIDKKIKKDKSKKSSENINKEENNRSSDKKSKKTKKTKSKKEKPDKVKSEKDTKTKDKSKSEKEDKSKQSEEEKMSDNKKPSDKKSKKTKKTESKKEKPDEIKSEKDTKTKDKNKSVKDDQSKQPKEEKISDEDLFEKSKIKKARENLNSETPKTDKLKEKKKDKKKRRWPFGRKDKDKTQKNKQKEVDVIQENPVKVEDNTEVIQEETSDKDDNKEENIKNPEEDKSIESKDLQINTEDKQIEESDEIQESKQEDMQVAIGDELIGKWVGELFNPQGDKGEILIDLKKSDSYIYVNKEGEKVPFKLLDLKINGKNIYFKIKPSPDSDYGIIFDGSLIQGVLSGTATDPTGNKGKWHAQKP